MSDAKAMNRLTELLADEAVMGMGLENLLIDRELAYEGPMGSELAELDHLRVQISLWFVESELTKVSELSAAWWARPQADDAAWHPINTDPACDSVSSEVHQALSRVRFGGSLMDAVRLGSHPSCSLILGTSTCATLFEAGRCARDAVAARPETGGRSGIRFPARAARGASRRRFGAARRQAGRRGRRTGLADDRNPCRGDAKLRRPAG